MKQLLSLVDLPDLRITIGLHMPLPFVYCDGNIMYKLELTVVQNGSSRQETTALLGVSLLKGAAMFGFDVRRNSPIDEAIQSGEKLPFVVAICSKPAAGEAIDPAVRRLEYQCMEASVA